MFKKFFFRNWNHFSRKQKLSKNVSSVFKRVWSFRKAWTSLQFVVLICLIGVFFYIWPEKKNKQIPTTFFFFLLFKGFCVNVNVNLSFPQLEKNFPFQYSPQNRKRKKKDLQLSTDTTNRTANKPKRVDYVLPLISFAAFNLRSSHSIHKKINK